MQSNNDRIPELQCIGCGTRKKDDGSRRFVDFGHLCLCSVCIADAWRVVFEEKDVFKSRESAKSEKPR